MSDTPKTDASIREVDVAFVSHWGLSSEPQKFVEPDFARELERENAALLEDIKTLCEIIDHANPSAWENGNTHPDGHGPDEGTVMMEQLYGPLWHKYVQTAIAAREGAQP